MQGDPSKSDLTIGTNVLSPFVEMHMTTCAVFHLLPKTLKGSARDVEADDMETCAVAKASLALPYW